MPEAFICDFTRTPIGRYGGVLTPDALPAVTVPGVRNGQLTTVQTPRWGQQALDILLPF